MKIKKIFISFFVVLLSGCPKPNSEKDESYFETALLFEKDGCKIYSFYDNGRVHYFTNCTETMTTVIYGPPKQRRHVQENIGGKK